MAKSKVNLKDLQKRYEERLSKQRKNQGNFSGIGISPRKPKDLTDADDFMFEGSGWKPNQRG